MAHPEPKIDPELKKLLDPKTPAELKLLKRKCKDEGQTQDLVGWEETGIVIGGMHRYEIFVGLGLKPRIDWRSFGEDTPENRDKVAAWMVDDQLAGRNLSPKRYDWYMARKYEIELKKNRAAGRRGANAAATVAAETGKSTRTVRRAVRKERAARGEAAPPRPRKKPGKVKFDHKKVDAAFGHWHRAVDELLDAYPAAPAAAKSLSRSLNQKNNEARHLWEQLVKICVGA